MNTQQTIRDLQSIAKQLRSQPDRNGKLETAVTNIYCAVAMINDWESQQQQPSGYLHPTEGWVSSDWPS